MPFFPGLADPDLAERLAGSRLFITGATGFFGKWLLCQLEGVARERDIEAVVVSRDPDGFRQRCPAFGRNLRLSFVRGDIRDFAFPDGPFDYVIHAATAASLELERNNPDEMYSVIVDGTRRVLDFCRQAAPRRLLYVSSGGVYGVQPPEVSHIPETLVCRPVTAYGKGKLRAEQMCLESGQATVVARGFAFVGAWLPLATHFAIGNFIYHCLRDEPIDITGDGTPLRSYMYGSDLAVWLLGCLLRGRSGEAYNVGSGEAVDIAALARLVRNVAGTDNEIRIHGVPVPGQAPPRYVPAVRKAMDELGLTLQVGLEQAIAATLAWHRAGGEGS